MKKILLLLILIPLVSCKDWLAVKPFDAMEKGEAYKNELNTNRVLNGLYISITKSNLYAKELSCGMLEVLAQHYVIPGVTGSGEHIYHSLNSFDFAEEKTKAIMYNVLRDAYKTIAECNEFLEMVEEKKNLYTEEKANIYMGEAIALRTLLHFDMLRLFGPIGSELDRESIPYYDLSTSIPTPILTANEVVDLLIADIDKSIEYLKRDPVLETGVIMTTGTVEFFRDYRNMRMNYYAANVLKARMCLYKGTDESKTLAYNICSALLEGKDPQDLSITNNFKEAFKFDNENLRKAYANEIIFGIQNIKRNNLYKEMFSSDLPKESTLGGGEKFINYLYGVSGSSIAIGGTDPVRSKMWQYSPSKLFYDFIRFADIAVNPYYPYHNHFQGVIRLGEVYAIAAETAPTVDLTRGLMDKWRQGKGYNTGNTVGLTDTQLVTLISNEFEKDTYGEGQFFFYAKRKGLNLRDSQNAAVKMDRAKFVPPLPQVELDGQAGNK